MQQIFIACRSSKFEVKSAGLKKQVSENILIIIKDLKKMKSQEDTGGYLIKIFRKKKLLEFNEEKNFNY